MSIDQLATPAPSDDNRATRRRKIRALLAGGLVLGVGAAVTLAVWTDNVFGQAEFAAENWNVQGDFTVDGSGVWGEYATDDVPGEFTFSTGFDALSPGTTVYSPVALRVGTGTAPGGAYPADITLVGATNVAGNLLAENLGYTVRSGITAANCNAAGFGGGSEVVPLSVLEEGSAVGAIQLAADGTPTSLCFAVTLPLETPADVVAGVETGPLVWQFEAAAVV